MNALEKTLRAYALRYPEAYEDFPWDERVIKVRGKIFAFLGMVDDRFRLGVKLTHSNEAALGLPTVEPSGYGLGRAGWVTVWVTRTGQPPTDLLKAWIDESYRTVAPKKLVASLPPAGHAKTPQLSGNGPRGANHVRRAQDRTQR